MVQSDVDTEKVKFTEHNFGHRGSQGSGLSREPSFSGWFNEDGMISKDYQEVEDQTVEDFDFELSLTREGGLGEGHLDSERSQYMTFQPKSMKTNGSNSKDGVSAHGMTNGNRRYTSFNIENGSRTEGTFLNIGDNGSDSMNNHGTYQSDSKSYISSIDVLKTIFFILVWYTFSTFLTLYNKTLLGDHLGNFPAPMLMNTIHFSMQAILSNAITWFWSQRFRPSVPMSWRDYFSRVVPTALGTAFDINLSNASLVFISVTFATMCKSASPIFLLIFAFAFRLESPSFKLLGIILVISIGILLTVAKETEFDFWGFIFVMLAAVMSGFRWTMTQILLQKEVYGLENPLTLMSYVTPIMAMATALLSLIIDPWDEFRKNSYFNSSWHIIRTCLLMLLGGTLAFFMVLTEYILVSVTSAVTVTIAGVVKEAVTILVAVFYFHDQFTWLKGVGLITIMVGVSLFNWYKYQKLQKGESGDHNVAASTSVPAKYVILEEMDDEEEDGPVNLNNDIS
ncbi:probable sugar phosphate/phosphate translocator At1g06470 isoform X2 [Diospyros lotus]|uniref:probable sugar phosphate/phosphate translocator At1g06470 isoform X1 n=1 Tax=Diospyros lotus TaxID=55363 RepID=UPI002252D38A|nr:probable sugar phosphate/phosphate translocator At1g06470 isoform X1 [Diospyros lotus]XP_052206340.1 probable sugar phosphate/phosphate translocator At1g06470 isoform X2 [Diospyros lotus]XP_052206341.1 probable sugar phosphate/phosphate translocator At1g06470 isoform X3 [Diospyros lotus]XP_052206342.1 probable sugar phosphate/phosphate translocator At1g06470 isoform X4 [Diospyros lotus]XP_052206343.1 probable sugar phosphate/phosphate translocator At1g06470 isoform X2 [Diospyros lotus]